MEPIAYGLNDRPETVDVMAGLVPAIHALLLRTKNVDARDKPGHDGLNEGRVHTPAAFFTITLR
jgi:hypothetical protein